MIDFSVGEEAQILLDAVERFSRDRLTDRMRQAEADRAPDADTRQLYENLGLMGLEAPGAGLGLVERCMVNEALGRADPGAALALDRLGPAGYALWAVEDLESATAVLDDPGRRAWLATPEDGAVNVSERAVSGQLYFAPAGVTDLVLLAPTGIAVVRSEINQSPVRGAGLRAADPVSLTMHDAPVARFHRFPSAAVLARARLYAASLLLGVLDAAARFARDYAMERITFGRPIAHHQAMTFMLTDMNTAVTGTRLLIHEAAWRLDTAGRDAAALQRAHEAAATAYIEAIEQSAFVGPAGVQVLGGLGFMQDYPVEKYMRESRALGLLYGGIDQAKDDAMAPPGTTLMAGGLF